MRGLPLLLNCCGGGGGYCCCCCGAPLGALGALVGQLLQLRNLLLLPHRLRLRIGRGVAVAAVAAVAVAAGRRPLLLLPRRGSLQLGDANVRREHGLVLCVQSTAGLRGV